jgi:uncharacterized protein YndB with AHSA1/START domain
MTPATDPADGTVEHRDGATILRFERRLAHPVDRVWAAMTEPARLREWLADPDAELTDGGAVSLRWLNTDDAGNHAVMDGTVTALRPPRLLEISGDPHGALRFELAEDGAGTRLVFTVTRPTDAALDLVLPGWHIHLEHLADALDGRPVDWAHWDRDHRPRWQELHDAYAARGGLTPA